MDFKTEIVVKEEIADINKEADSDLNNHLKIDIEIKREDLFKLEWEESPLFDDKFNFSDNNNPNITEDYKVNYEAKNNHSALHSIDLNAISLEECNYCENFFRNRFSLIKHQLIHLKLQLKRIESYSCAHCNKFFHKKYDLQHHIYFKHYTFTKNWKPNQDRTCHFCSKTLTYKHWFEHMNTVHLKMNLNCDKCERTFQCPKYFKRHKKKHECKRVINDKLLNGHGAFLKKENAVLEGEAILKKENAILKDELAILKEEEIYSCDICPAMLRSKNALKTHKRNCHDKNYNCTVCPSKLKSKAYLLQHMLRVHYDDGKQYICGCGKVFRSPRYLSVHKRNAVKSNSGRICSRETFSKYEPISEF